MYYDRDGSPLTPLQWSAKFEDIPSRRIGWHEHPDGRHLSTVWLGLDHQFGQGPPLIFESCLFPGDVLERYSTEQEAKDGHARLVAEVLGPEAVDGMEKRLIEDRNLLYHLRGGQ